MIQIVSYLLCVLALQMEPVLLKIFSWFGQIFVVATLLRQLCCKKLLSGITRWGEIRRI